jgi:hypothetical protein
LQNGIEICLHLRFAINLSAIFCRRRAGHKVELGEYPQIITQYVK